MPKISVIVPVYNTEKYLPKCLDSLISQTLTDLEIICVNDGSSDGSLDILYQYANRDRRIKIINFEENKGVSIARNSGIEAATGEYLCFVDSDDFVDLDFYEKLYHKAKKTGADIVKGDLKEIFPDGREKVYDLNETILTYKNKLCFYYSFTSAIYKLSLVKEKHCFFDSRLTYSEDVVWLNRIVIAADSMEIVPNIYYNYCRREDSTDTQTLSEKNVYSAYVGWKHVFLNTKAFSKDLDIDSSFCYQRYFQGVLSYIFRSPEFKFRVLFCKLLFFFYYSYSKFYDQYLSKNMIAICSFFRENQLNEFVNFMQDKYSYSDIDFVLARLRYNIRQQKLTVKPKLSIVIPIYNSEDYLEKCLESVCRQTYKNLEIICVDDCSRDNSIKILNTYSEKDARIRIIQRKENGGQAAARQSGIDAATGEYIGFIDSDDWIDESYYKKMVEKAQQDKTDIIVNGNILVHEGKKNYPFDFPGHKQLEQKIYDNPSQFIDKFFCVVWNKLFRAEFLKEKKYTIPERSAHEDLFFHYATFAFAKNISFFYGPPYHYLLRDQSMSHIAHDWGVEHIKVFAQIFNFYKEHNLLNKKIKLYSTMPFFNIKNEEMFQEYKKYFTKVHFYLNDNKDIFNVLDLFFADTVCECKNYEEYASKCPGNLLMSFLRRKK